MADEYRSFTGEIRNLTKKNDFIYEVEIWLLNDMTNRNNWRYTNMEANKDQFAGTPILIAYTNNGATIGAGHEMKMEYDENGEPAPTFTGANHERIIGSMSEKTEDIRVETVSGGVQWIVGKGFIWKWYAKEAVEKIERDSQEGKPMSISIETLVSENHEDEDGVEVEDTYLVLGTTILGDGVAPAVAGAHIKALQEIESEFKELRLRAASYIQANEEEKVEEPLIVNETISEPQAKSTERNEKALNIFTKKQLAELEPKFDGYTVLSAGQDEAGIHVCLMSKSGDAAVYTMAEAGDLIDPNKIAKVNPKATFAADNWEIPVDVEVLTDEMSATIINTNSELEQAKSELQGANETIRSMTEKEMNRRLSAAKASAQATLDAFNANRVDKVDSSILTKINEAIENGDFSECENAEGEWCGEEAVANQVLAACAKCVMEMDKVTAQKNNSQFIWEGIQNKGNVDNGDVASLLASIPMLND